MFVRQLFVQLERMDAVAKTKSAFGYWPVEQTNKPSPRQQQWWRTLLFFVVIFSHKLTSFKLLNSKQKQSQEAPICEKIMIFPSQ